MCHEFVVLLFLHSTRSVEKIDEVGRKSMLSFSRQYSF